MLSVISPAKKLSESCGVKRERLTSIPFTDDTHALIDVLIQKSPHDIQALMKLSPALAELNVARYHRFDPQADKEDLFAALFHFQGDVYQSLEASTLNEEALEFAQRHLNILSGLYGLLRPFDGIQSYRLEMGTKLETALGKNLYQFWGEKIADLINQRLDAHQSQYLINLASNEYSKAICQKILRFPMITIDFKEEKNGELKTIGIHAKRARGAMARFIVENAIDEPKNLRSFCKLGYQFDASLSEDNQYCFVRNTP